MEDRDNSVINALKRLERAGSEHSRTTQKLIEAADRLAEEIAPMLWDIGLPHRGVRGKDTQLPRRYIIGGDTRELAYLRDYHDTRHYLGHGKADRTTALHFAHDIATGWLGELAEWVEKQGEGNAEATAKLERAARGMEAQP